jgi:hypothetical protein
VEIDDNFGYDGLAHASPLVVFSALLNTTNVCRPELDRLKRSSLQAAGVVVVGWLPTEGESMI